MANRNDLARQFRRRRDRELATSFMHQMRAYHHERKRMATRPSAPTPRRLTMSAIRNLFTSIVSRRNQYDSADR